MADDPHHLHRRRLGRIEATIRAQRTYISRVPDPDNRYQAETNLMTLLEMREALAPSDEAAAPAGPTGAVPAMREYEAAFG